MQEYFEIDAHGNMYVYYQPALQQRHGVVKRTQRVNDYVFLDFDEEGKLFGVELLNVPRQA